jgi:hypothetical protein
MIIDPVFIWLIGHHTTRGGHKIPRTENRTEFTENGTEIYRTEIFGSMFGSEFARTEVPR